MQYDIVIDPKLGVSPAEFADVWNEFDETIAAGVAVVKSGGSARQFDPGLTEIFVSILTGLASSALYDLTKSAVVRSNSRKNVVIVEITQTNGDHLLFVRVKEDE